MPDEENEFKDREKEILVLKKIQREEEEKCIRLNIERDDLLNQIGEKEKKLQHLDSQISESTSEFETVKQKLNEIKSKESSVEGKLITTQGVLSRKQDELNKLYRASIDFVLGKFFEFYQENKEFKNEVDLKISGKGNQTNSVSSLIQFEQLLSDVKSEHKVRYRHLINSIHEYQSVYSSLQKNGEISDDIVEKLKADYQLNDDDLTFVCMLLQKFHKKSVISLNILFQRSVHEYM